MSLDVYLVDDRGNEVYTSNITHNLGRMAEEAGIYKHCWRPEEIGIHKARELIIPLCNGIILLVSDPDRFKAFDAPNGWGLYEHFVPWVSEYLHACVEYPLSEIKVSR